MCPAPPGPPSPTASPAAPAWFPLPEPGVLSSAPPPRQTPGDSASAPRAPQDRSCWSCPPTACSFPPSSPSLSSGSLCCRHRPPRGTWTMPGTLSTRQTVQGPSDHCPARDSSARAPRALPSKGAGGAGPHPRLTSRAARLSTVPQPVREPRRPVPGLRPRL